MYRIKLFGAVSVERDGVEVPIRGTIPRAFIARLALTPRTVVSPEELMRSIWADRPPAAASSLRAHVSRLRSTDLAGLVRGGRGGYALEIDDDEVDIGRFRTLIDERRLTEAEQLWLGDPMAGLEGIPFADAERDLLWQERRDAAVIRAGLDNSAAAMKSLATLVEKQPLDEELALLLATATSKAGRTWEALAILDDFGRRLREASGLEPSPRLANLRQSIVRFDTTVSPVSLRAESGVDRRSLPLPVTSFVGRGAEIGAIANARATSRLITLVGPGGAGKTRTAIESARQQTSREDSEQWMLDLSFVAEPDGVVDALARLLGAESVSLEAISAQLGGRRGLLILDNAEHLRERIAHVATHLLTTCAGLTVMVTSRAALRIPGERVIPILPFVSTTDAAALFTARAADVSPGFELVPEVEAQVRAICARLDWLPLAIEIAAARLDNWDLATLAHSIEADGPLGIDEERPVGRGLGETIEWSVGLLDYDQRVLLSQLAWFHGSFTQAAVEAICTRSHALTALSRQSLLSTELVGGIAHFRVPEAVRSYVGTAGATALWRANHLDYFASWIGGVDRLLRTEESMTGHDLIESARAELRFALATAVETGNREAGLRITGGQAWHLFRRGALVEGRQAIDRALAIDGNADAAVEGRALFGAVMLIYRSAEPVAGRPYADAGMAMAHRSNDADLLALFWACTGMWSAIDGDERLFQQRLERAYADRDALSFWVVADLHLFRATGLLHLQKIASSLDALADAADAAVIAGHQWAYTSASERSSHLLIRLKRGRDALRHLALSTRRSAFDGDALEVLGYLHTAAGACAQLERFVEGAHLLGAIDSAVERYGYDPSWIAVGRARAYRDMVSSGLKRSDWLAALADGRRMTLAQAVALLDSLARE